MLAFFTNLHVLKKFVSILYLINSFVFAIRLILVSANVYIDLKFHQFHTCTGRPHIVVNGIISFGKNLQI